MKVTCDVVKDLILLKETDNVSDDSNVIIDEHLSTCEECRKYNEDLKASMDAFKEPELSEEAVADKKVLKKRFAKIKKHWVASLICTFVIVPAIIVLLILGKNEILGAGRRFSNFDEIKQMQSFFEMIEDGQYEEAAKLIDFTEEYEYIMSKKDVQYVVKYKEMYGDIFSLSFEEFEELMIKETIFELEAFSEKYSINDVSYYDSSQYTVRKNNQGETVVSAHSRDREVLNVIFSGEDSQQSEIKISFNFVNDKLRFDGISIINDSEGINDIRAFFTYKDYIDKE